MCSDCDFQGNLTKGLQCGNSLVRQASLSTLCNMLSAHEQTLSSLERARRHAQQEFDHLSSDHLLQAGRPPVRTAASSLTAYVRICMKQGRRHDI